MNSWLVFDWITEVTDKYDRETGSWYEEEAEPEPPETRDDWGEEEER